MQKATYQCLSKTGLLSNREEERKEGENEIHREEDTSDTVLTKTKELKCSEGFMRDKINCGFNVQTGLFMTRCSC